MSYRKILLLIASATAVILPGCTCRALVSVGKSGPGINSHQMSVPEVRGKLGDPVYRQELKPPRLVKQTKEYQDYRNQDSKPFRLDYDSRSGDRHHSYTPVSLVEVYELHGYYINQEHIEVCQIISRLTLGVGDLVLFPANLVARIAAEFDTNYITVWYDKNGRYLASAKVHINEPETLEKRQ